MIACLHVIIRAWFSKYNLVLALVPQAGGISCGSAMEGKLGASRANQASNNDSSAALKLSLPATSITSLLFSFYNISDASHTASQAAFFNYAALQGLKARAVFLRLFEASCPASRSRP